MSINELSSGFRKLLEQAGWKPDRSVRVEPWILQLESEGFHASPLAKLMLESLGGLKVKLPPTGESNPYEHVIAFDPVRAATGEFDRVEEWQGQLGVRLFPIGEELRSGNVIWLGEDGRVYYGRGFGLYRIGDSIPEAMDNLAFLTSPPSICCE